MCGDVDSPVVVTRQRVKTRLSDELRAWIEREGEATLGGLIDTFGSRAFAIVSVMLLGVPLARLEDRQRWPCRQGAGEVDRTT
jgi:hypothetical protein